jgi:hypothetical protein
VGVVALVESEQRADGQRYAAVDRIGGQQLRRPRVITDAVDDCQLRRGHRPSVGGRRFVGVGVLRRVDDDALDAGVGARELKCDAAPEVLGGDDPDSAATRTGNPDAGAAGGANSDRRQQPELQWNVTHHTKLS